MEMDIHGIHFNFILFSAPTSFNMREFVFALNGSDFLPIAHPTGFKQIIFVDFKNIYRKGHNALFLHCSP
jgi:hypothetical protein